MVIDHRKLPRRRGEALNAAIFQATMDELAETGYAKLTMERIAERAKASKASLYRRWPSRVELVMDAVYHLLPDPAAPQDTGSLRGDLLALLGSSVEPMAGPAGEAMRGLLSDSLSDPALAARIRAHSHGANRKAIQEILVRAAERGEISGGGITPRRLEVAQAMLRHHMLTQGLPIPDSVVVEIVDEVLVPLFSAGPATTGAGTTG